MSLRRGWISIPLPNSSAPISEWRWTRQSGTTRSLWREGPFNSLLAQTEGLKLQYDSIVISRKIGNWFRLEAAQADDNISELFEVIGSNLMQSKIFGLVLRARFRTAGFAGSEDELSEKISSIAASVNNYKTGQGVTYASMVSEVTALFPAGDQLTIALRLMDDLDRNGDSFLTAQYAFRHTISLSERAFLENGSSLFSGLYDATDMVFTEDELRAVEFVPNEFIMPKKVIDNSQPQVWLKQPSHAVFTNNRRTVVLDYLGADEWSDLHYA